uniref:RRM domain-containing protein n=1 Tax=Alexandrium andersonii TaxID=327968 RepID=A0A7S2CEZ7_9DINO|mmetsp:Transcript_37788/g.85908  ORF Transcript_37788/g.85908 Transcript_37788/m.85908 type:complete len:285 (+) Transcript_37788:112-966(+)
MLETEPALPVATRFEREAAAAARAAAAAADAPPPVENGSKDVENGSKDWLPDEPRMVYVGNLAWSVKWQDLKDHMKQAGTVEFARILTVDGSDWGRSRGIAYVRYSTEDEAKAAVATLNQTELSGRAINVDVWTGGKPGPGGKFGGKGFGGGKGGAKGLGGFKGGFGFWGKGFGGKGSAKVYGEFNQMVYVGNLPYKAEWQELKDHMKSVGTVEFVKILTDDGSDYGRSKGIGCVRYSTEEMAEQAVATLNGSEFMGRQIVVDTWTKSERPAAPAPEAAPAPPA